ncbi:MAG: hypothetical protein KF744_16650 [Taibaiella sp.]|nr:hypothetical protein [Taibaiella sp.]
MFKRVVELLPILYVVVVVLSFCSLTFYYSNLSIDIYNYVETSEILLGFLSSILKVADRVTNIIYFSFISLVLFLDVDDLSPKSVRILRSFVMLLLLSVSWFQLPQEYRIEVSFFIFMGLGSTFMIYDIVKKKESRLLPYVKYFACCYWFLLAVGLIQQVSRKQMEITVAQGGVAQIEFTYRTTKVQTDKTRIFVGETKNFLFVYDKLQKATRIYKRSDIDSMSVTSK